jgi:hypothetical protein
MRFGCVSGNFTQQQYCVSGAGDVVARSGETLLSPGFTRARKPGVMDRRACRASAGTDGTPAAIMEFFYERKNNLFCVQSLN